MSHATDGSRPATALAIVPKPPDASRRGRLFQSIPLPAQMPPADPPEPTDTDAAEIGGAAREPAPSAGGAPAATPPPERVLETAPMLQPTLVAPIEVAAEPLQGFLTALGKVAADRPTLPILANVRMMYNGEKLLLEATDLTVWAAASLRAFGGTQRFECILPLERAVNVVKRTRTQYNAMTLGLDAERIHLGPYSFPHGGKVVDFPRRPPLLPDEARVVLPAHYLGEILRRVVIACSTDTTREHLTGVHLDFEAAMAVATDGHRLHALRLGQMHVESKDPLRRPPRVTVSPTFFRYLVSVVNRDWVGVSVHERMLAVAGEDYAAFVRTIEEPYPEWRKIVPRADGTWVVDKEALLAIVQQTLPLKSEHGIKLGVDNITEKLTVSASGPGGETFQTSLPARRCGGIPTGVVGVSPQYLVQAITAAAGGLIRLTLGEPLDPILVRGEDDEFLAVVMPMRL